MPSRSPPSSSSVTVASPLKKRERRERRPVAQGEELSPFVPPVAVAPSPLKAFKALKALLCRSSLVVIARLLFFYLF
ncbi:hypothetical protein AHAS_Ahas15G0256400 [Arachis hypogaea]